MFRDLRAPGVTDAFRRLTDDRDEAHQAVNQEVLLVVEVLAPTSRGGTYRDPGRVQHVLEPDPIMVSEH